MVYRKHRWHELCHLLVTHIGCHLWPDFGTYRWNFVMAIDNFGTVVIVTYIQHYQGDCYESWAKRIVDTETGEILSSRKIKPNANFVQFYRNEIGSIRELIKDEPKAASLFPFLVWKMDQENALIVSRNFVRIFWNFKKNNY